VTGIYDFQASSYGSRLFDFMRVEGDFTRTQPPGVYSNPEFVQRFYRGYQAVGGTESTFGEIDHIILDVIRKARQVRYWWDCARFLHPRNPEHLQDVLTGLEKLIGMGNREIVDIAP